MRRERFAATAAGPVALGKVEFIEPGQKVFIAAAGATADTLTAEFNGAAVVDGLINVETSADVVEYPRDLVGSFTARTRGQLIINLAGTVTGTHIDVWVMQPNEARPW